MYERSGATAGLESCSDTGGMGGDYTSWGSPIKRNEPNSPRPLLELEHCRGWLRESPQFAGKWAPTVCAERAADRAPRRSGGPLWDQESLPCQRRLDLPRHAPD